MLLGDGASVLPDPLPDPLYEGVTADILSGLAFLDELAFDDDLGSYACVVGAREPEGGVAHHAMPADECVLGGSGEGVAEVKLAGDVGRGHDDDKGLLAFLDAGLEVAVVHPGLVNAAFDLGGVVDLGNSSEVFGARGHGWGVGGRWGFSGLASTVWGDSNFGGNGESIGGCW